LFQASGKIGQELRENEWLMANASQWMFRGQPCDLA
jgi:hypothetical protein